MSYTVQYMPIYVAAGDRVPAEMEELTVRVQQGVFSSWLEKARVSEAGDHSRATGSEAGGWRPGRASGADGWRPCRDSGAGGWRPGRASGAGGLRPGRG